MGWTFQHKEKEVSIKEFFEKEYNSETVKILDVKVVAMKTAYLAVQHTDHNGFVKVFAAVCLLDYQHKNWFNFGYKDMDETMWPNEAKCPSQILNMLSETENENALNWRKQCRANIVKASNLNTLKVGDTIKFELSFSFGKYGKNASTFKLVDKKKNHFYSVDLNINVKLTKSTVLDNIWTIVKGA